MLVVPTRRTRKCISLLAVPKPSFPEYSSLAILSCGACPAPVLAAPRQPLRRCAPGGAAALCGPCICTLRRNPQAHPSTVTVAKRHRLEGYHVSPPPSPHRHLCVLPYPILSCMSRLRHAALRLAPVRSGGAAAPRWVRVNTPGGQGRQRGALGGALPGAGAKRAFVFPIRSAAMPAARSRAPWSMLTWGREGGG